MRDRKTPFHPEALWLGEDMKRAPWCSPLLRTALLAGTTSVLLGVPSPAAQKAAGPASPPESSSLEEDWWAIRPLTRPLLPTVKDTSWPLTPIDWFILAALERKGMRPSPFIDRIGFIRRATYDLHGLPPTPKEIDDFVNDQSPDALARLIDRLLASPRYGERWGRHWLDIIHYADTHGYDKDKRRLWAWLFRDWVIRALNQDLPYRRFVRYQLAGDVFYPGDPDGIVATGFVVAGPWDFVGNVELREGTVEKEKTRVLDRDDMVTNTMSTFVSLTAHCARCHDHKFDPIPQKDYYRLQAVFAGVERGDRFYPAREVRERQLALQKQQQFLLARRDTLLNKIKEVTTPELTRRENELSELRKQLADLPLLLKGALSPTNGYHSDISPKADVEKWVQVDLGQSMALDEIRLIPARPTDFPDSPGFGFPARWRIDLADEPGFGRPETIADHTKRDYPNPKDNPVAIRVAGKRARYVRVTGERLWLRMNDYVFALAELQALAGGKNLARGKKVNAKDSIEFGRWSTRYLVDDFDSRHRLPDLADPLIAKAVDRRIDLLQRIAAADGERRALAAALIDSATQTELAKIATGLELIGKQIEEVHAAVKAYAVVPRPPRAIHVLKRGEVLKKKELVGAGALSLVPGLAATFKLADINDEGSRRAALADWITHPRNMLTWRSIVNRIWQYHFGQGLVDTPNDFGKNGSKPTHPELLNWLAVEFRDGGQSLKKLHRMILLSAAYRQSSRHNAAYARLDADNRYLWRMNRRRLDAESIRDGVLAVSGKLAPAMYGPGYDLFRFKDDHSPVYDHTALERIHDPETYRRTVYRFVVRSVPNPFLESLDCADPNINVPVRNTTLTALQALALLNNPFMVKQAEFFAERVTRLGPDLPAQIDAAYRLAFGRRPIPEEKKMMTDHARRHGLANACRLLLNSNEFVFID
jgi:hypothetical protein